MLNETMLEERLINLEKTVSDLQRKLNSSSAPENWLENLIGSIFDGSAFLESLRYGRAFRQADDSKHMQNSPGSHNF